MAPKPRHRMFDIEEDPNKVLLKLQVKDGSRACFIDMADTRVSAEQRLMELRLEKLDEECVELRNKRLEYWTAPLKQIHSNLQLPEQHKHVDIVALRKERLAENARAARCDAAHAAVHQHQVLTDEMSTLMERVSTVSVLGPMLVDFCDKHADRIARRRCCYLRRVASLCKSVESLETIAPLLQQRLAETDAEFAVVTESKRTMSHTLPIAIKEEETRENLERMASGDVKAPEGRKTGNKDAAPKAGIVLPGRTGAEAAAARQPIPKDMMRLFLRWSTAHVRMQKRVQRFLAKVQWLVYTQRYELLRRAKAILVNPALTPGASNAAAAHAMAAGGAAQSKMPTMVQSMDKLNMLNANLKSHFNIQAEVEADNALAFAFEVKSILNALHAVQTADTTYPPYDTTLVGPSMLVPTGAIKGGAEGRGKGRAAGGIGSVGVESKGVLDTNFLKPCPWIDDCVVQVYVCMYIRMYCVVQVYVCMYIRMYVTMYACIDMCVCACV